MKSTAMVDLLLSLQIHLGNSVIENVNFKDCTLAFVTLYVSSSVCREVHVWLPKGQKKGHFLFNANSFHGQKGLFRSTVSLLNRTKKENHLK